MKKKNKLVEFASAGLPRANVKLSDGTVVKLRAFAVKEMKLLMMAFTSGTAQDVQVLQILNQCIETDGIDAGMLPSNDVEMLYLELYKLSKGTKVIPVRYRCTCEIDGKECGTGIAVNINLDNVKMVGGADKRIELTNGLKLNMRYPNVLECQYFDETDESAHEEAFNMAMRCIASIDTGTETLTVGEDVSYEEVAEVIEYLDEASFSKLITFVRAIPTIGMSFPIKCSECGHEEVVELRGLADFFE